MPLAESRRLGGLKVGKEVRGHGLEIVLPQRSVARGFAGRIPHHHRHFGAPADLPQAGQDQAQERQANGELHRRRTMRAVSRSAGFRRALLEHKLIPHRPPRTVQGSELCRLPIPKLAPPTGLGRLRCIPMHRVVSATFALHFGHTGCRENSSRCAQAAYPLIEGSHSGARFDQCSQGLGSVTIAFRSPGDPLPCAFPSGRDCCLLSSVRLRHRLSPWAGSTSAASRGLGDRQEPAASRDLLGPQRLGQLPALFAIRRDGTIVREFRLSVPNIDWEDIATDDQGHLYLGDIGNNGGLLAVRASTGSTSPTRRGRPRIRPRSGASFYRFPRRPIRRRGPVLTIGSGSAIVVSKRLDGREAELFAVPFEPPAPLLRPAMPAADRHLARLRRARHRGRLSADPSPGGLLVRRDQGLQRSEKERPGTLLAEVRYGPQAIEGISWDGVDLILVSEGRGSTGSPRRPGSDRPGALPPARSGAIGGRVGLLNGNESGCRCRE